MTEHPRHQPHRVTVHTIGDLKSSLWATGAPGNCYLTREAMAGQEYSPAALVRVVSKLKRTISPNQVITVL